MYSNNIHKNISRAKQQIIHVKDLNELSTGKSSAL